MNEDQYAEVRATLAANETEHKSFRRRLDEHDGQLKEQNKIIVAMERQSSAIESMNQSVGRVEKKVDSIDGRVAQLEREPGEKWKRIAFEVLKYLVIALVGAAAGYIINGIGK